MTMNTTAHSVPGADTSGERPTSEPSVSEILVGHGFRGWIAGYQTGDVGCWERVWRLYSNTMSPASARVVVGCLAAFAKSVNCCSRRKVEVGAAGQCGFCRDEVLAVSMVAASQHNTCPAMRACAFALVETALLDDVLHHADTFAITLRSQQYVISPRWIVNANAYVDPSPMLPH
ncbi:MAG: hypothetical protein APF80_11265 [Alphaproteobacteria bacterium BRH_c36]|nr:MAG: hypothetical protein APF80_11265 [Alphaproteobacteria bacterium BRH_c36]